MANDLGMLLQISNHGRGNKLESYCYSSCMVYVMVNQKIFTLEICQAFFVCHWSVDIPCFTNSLYSLSPLCENTIGKFRKGWEIFCWTESNSGKDFQTEGVFACAHHLPILRSILLNMSPWEYSWRTITDELLSWSFYFSARVWQTESHRYIAIQPDTRDWWAQVRIKFV